MNGKGLYDAGWRLYKFGGDYIYVAQPSGDEYTLWLPEYFHKYDTSAIEGAIGCTRDAVLELDEICESSGHGPPAKES